MTKLSDPQKEPRIYWSIKNDCWVLDHDLRCTLYIESESEYEYVEVTVPAGYETNLASVPFFLRPVVAMYGRYNFASILHDWLYENHGHIREGLQLSRAACDREFFEAMANDSVPVWQAVSFWAAVRINPFNFYPFKKWQ